MEFIFSCDDCKHFDEYDGDCECGYVLCDPGQDAYDCPMFEEDER